MTLVDSEDRDEIKRRRRIGAALLLPRERVAKQP
jgi:hypothetical protein